MLPPDTRTIVFGNKKGERQHATMGAMVVSRRAVATRLFAVQNISVDGNLSGRHDRTR